MFVFKYKKQFIITAFIVAAGAASFAYYLFNLPHRDVQSSQTDYSISSSQLVSEYLNNPTSADHKYLSDDGDSKILEIHGIVASVDTDFNGLTVVLLKSANDKAGSSCTMTGEKISDFSIGQKVRIKGVIRSGAAFDADLNMYENIIMEKCKLITL